MSAHYSCTLWSPTSQVIVLSKVFFELDLPWPQYVQRATDQQPSFCWVCCEHRAIPTTVYLRSSGTTSNTSQVVCEAAPFFSSRLLILVSFGP